MNHQHRFLARIIIEAKSPLNIGSGNKGIKTDSLVLRDINGLPFIPGTTIAGLLRHSLEKNEEYLMGSQDIGSPLIITEAKMLNYDGQVLDGILSQEQLNSRFLVYFRQLPIRQHVKIGHRGSAIKEGKFDEEIVFKGTRFCFEMEMLSEESDDTAFKKLLNTLNSDTFRIGSGSRSGFGEIEVVDSQCLYKKIDLTDEEQKAWYLKKSSSLSEPWHDAEILKLQKPMARRSLTGLPSRLRALAPEWISYEIELKPIDLLLFGSGLGNEKADITFVRETFVKWSGEQAEIADSARVLLIPVSSLKGALSHRVAFHYNRLTHKYADTLSEGECINDFVGKNNAAVKALFGSEGDKGTDGKMQNKQRGNVLMSDIIEETSLPTKLLNHVSIDRFTGGAIDGALFNEETLYAKGHQFILKLLVNQAAFKDNEDVRDAFHCALQDLCSGMLPLGGGVNRGNGCFEGKIKRNGELIYENN